MTEIDFLTVAAILRLFFDFYWHSLLIITGDFSFPGVGCSTGSPTIVDNFTETFCEILDDRFLTQTNLYITRPNVTN